MFPLLSYIMYSFGYLIIECDGLGLLDIAQGGHIKHHPVHIVGVTSDLSKQTLKNKHRFEVDIIEWMYCYFQLGFDERE